MKILNLTSLNNINTFKRTEYILWTDSINPIEFAELSILCAIKLR